MDKRNVRDVSLEVLVRVEREQSYSNMTLNRLLQQSELTGLDKHLATELVYGTIQRRGTLDWILAPFVKKGLAKLDTWVLELLRMSAYQIMYLDKIPERAAVHEAVELAKMRGHRGIASFVNAVLRNLLRSDWQKRIAAVSDPVRKMALEHSHPEWLIKRWLREWDADTVAALCQTNNAPPPHTVRVNTLRASLAQLTQKLDEATLDADVRPSPLSPQGLRVHGVGNMGTHPWYRDGWYTVQDESAMLVGHIVNPEPGTRVLDMCAAPGGKTTHLAELMRNEGTIEAFDFYKHKIHLVTQNAKRLGVNIITAKQADSRELPERITGQFDYVLLDAPCSGFGVIRRKPEIKWRRKEADIERLVHLQRELLAAAAKLVKPDGALIYSTCTLETQENEQQIDWLQQQFPQYRLDSLLSGDLPKEVVTHCQLVPGMVRIMPQHFASDGFFIARLKHLSD